MPSATPPPKSNNVEQLQQIARLQHAQLTRALTIIEEQSAELDRLRGVDGELQLRLDQLLAQRTKDEATASGQATGTKSKRKRKKRETFGPTPQPDLEEVTEQYLLDEADRVCARCGEPLEAWAGQVERSEMVDVVEIRYVLKHVEQQKYACKCGECIETAPGPERAIKGGRYSLPFGLKVAVDKYLDHLPLDRQARIMKRHGLAVTSQTLWHQLEHLARELRPHYEALLGHILGQGVIGLDQTCWPNLGKGRQKAWQMWVLTSTDAIYHTIRDDKGVATFQDLVGNYSGVIVADCLSTHLAAEKQAAARDGPEEAFTHAACWAHVLRRFRDVQPDFPGVSTMLDYIGELYAIDAKAGSDAERAALRSTESAAVIAKMHTWLGKLNVPSELALGKAALYALGHWNRLKVFLTNPKVWLDNNRTERAIRGPVVGRRNHFGSKSRRGTQVAAVLYTLMETAKLHAVNPHDYLDKAIRASRLTDGRELLLPWDLAGTSAP